jgi:Protein of unknown function (DUF3592)
MQTDRMIIPMNDYQKMETDSKRYPSKSPSGEKRNPVGACCFFGCLGIVACIAVFCAAIFLGGFAIGIAGIKKGYESESWLTVEGKILSTAIDESRSTTRDSQTGRDRIETYYHGVVKYEYVVSGQTFASDRISYKSYGASREQAQRVIDAYRVGSSVTVHYNPENPSESVLEPGVGWATFQGPLLWLSPFVLLILVVGGLILRARKKKTAWVEQKSLIPSRRDITPPKDHES